MKRAKGPIWDLRLSLNKETMADLKFWEDVILGHEGSWI